VLVKSIAPDRATEFAERVRAETTVRLEHRLNRLLAPTSAAYALEEYYYALLDGKDQQQAAEVLKPYAERGVPLPFDP
jgi:hypothetical protein